MTEVSRVSTFFIQQKTQRNFSEVQSSLVTLQDQISSGFKARNFEGINGDIEEFIGLEAKIKRLDNYQNNSTEALSRLKVTRNSIAQIIDITDDIENLITLRRNGALANSAALEQQIRTKRDTLVNEVNISLEGRFLFSGTATNTPPVRTPIPATVVTGTPDNAYYQGSTENSTFRAQDNYKFSYGIRADAEPFQKIFAALDLALVGDNTGDEDLIANSLDMLQDGMEGMISLQARADADIIDMETIKDRHQQSSIYFRGVKEEIINTDILEATTKVALDQTILQATFQTYAKLSSLKLSDYL